MVPLAAAQDACARRAHDALSGAAPFFSVIIPTRGEESKLLPLLDALSRQTMPRDRWEILLAFDAVAPTAAARGRLEALAARAVALAERRGPGAARNRAAVEARGAFLAFTEDDCVPADDWLAMAGARLANDPGIDVLEGETLSPGGGLARRRHRATPNYLPTNLFVRRTLFVRIGGYCEAYFDPRRAIYFREDSDFGFALEEAGANIRLEPAAVVTHPVEHRRFLDPIRWARRYEMDPLLEERHHARFRERIEVARLGPFLLRRPLVRACGAYALALAAAGASALLGEAGLAWLWVWIAALSLLPVWAKWRFEPRRLPLVPLVPFVLLHALWRGRLRAAARRSGPGRGGPTASYPGRPTRAR